MKAFLVAGIGYGDEGKGTIVDALARRHGASMVVRYNGGAQAAHNVVTPEGLHHTFAQFGSGTFAGARTFLSDFVVVDPPALLREGDALIDKGIANAFNLIAIDRDALLVHPYNVALNQIRELARGKDRHGSTGRGIGETVVDSELALRARDLLTSGEKLTDKLHVIKKAKEEQAHSILRAQTSKIADAPKIEELLWRYFSPTESDKIFDDWIRSCHALRRRVAIVQPGYLKDHAKGCVVFEGAQGVLLDLHYGFHPYTTWSDVTFNNAFDLLVEMGGDQEVRRIGVTRAYASRHGPGPFPTENDEWCMPRGEHNVRGDWQGPMRFGELDMFAAEYAVHCLGGVDELAVTCLDHLRSQFAVAEEGISYCSSYRLDDAELSLFDFESMVPDARGAIVDRVEPTYDAVDDEGELRDRLEDRLGAHVAIESWGPTATDKIWRDA